MFEVFYFLGSQPCPTVSNQERLHRFFLFLIFLFNIEYKMWTILDSEYSLLAINIVQSENMIFGCKLSDLVFEVFPDFSSICILQFVLMKCITAPNVTLFSRSTRISRRPGALSRSPMVASLDSQKCH